MAAETTPLRLGYESEKCQFALRCFTEVEFQESLDRAVAYQIVDFHSGIGQDRYEPFIGRRQTRRPKIWRTDAAKRFAIRFDRRMRTHDGNVVARFERLRRRNAQLEIQNDVDQFARRDVVVAV